MNYEEFKHDIQNAPAGGLTPMQQLSSGEQDESLFNKLSSGAITGAVPSFSGGKNKYSDYKDNKKVPKTVRRRTRNQRSTKIFNKDLDINVSNPDSDFSIIKKRGATTKGGKRIANIF